MKHIFDSGEFRQETVVSILETTAADRKRYSTKFYNLDAVLSVGYCVNSISATLFRIWASHVLKEYILRGESINQRIKVVHFRGFIQGSGKETVLFHADLIESTDVVDVVRHLGAGGTDGMRFFRRWKRRLLWS